MATVASATVDSSIGTPAGSLNFSAVPPPTEAVAGTAGSFAWGIGPPSESMQSVDGFLYGSAAASDMPSGVQTPAGWSSMAGEVVTDPGLQTPTAFTESMIDRELTERMVMMLPPAADPLQQHPRRRGFRLDESVSHSSDR